MVLSTFKHWDLVVMFVLMAAITGFEMLGVFDTHYVTLTAIIKDFIPIPCRVMVLAWLCWHFFISDLVALASK